MHIRDEEYDRLNMTIDALRKEYLKQTEEIESLNNTVASLEKYRQRCKELENENYSVKLDKQNLIGLRDALNSRIEELEDQLNILNNKQ
jgi:predicted nuclease with TOPRIM domain